MTQVQCDAMGALPVLYADEALAVVCKPAGLMVHDSVLARGETDFAADRLREQFGKPIFLVHRLDRATSGCLLLAFDRDTASALGKTLMAHDVEKDYWAVCRGWPEERFVIDHPLDGGPGKPQKKPAITRFARLATCELALPSQGFATSRYALLCAQPETGRFRQIRRHLKHAFHHLIGDTSHDMHMARAAGVAALGVAWGYHAAVDLTAAGADIVIQRFDEVEPAIDRLLNTHA